MIKTKKVLLKNTIMLYILQFSAYFFSFITTPYQTRVLGPEIIGKLGFAAAIMVYFQLFTDFGFLLSATADISKNRDDKPFICRTVTSVNIIKAIFCLISLLVMLGMCCFSENLKEDVTLYLLYFAGTAVNAFMPDYLYRGLEKMTIITVRTVIIRLFFTVMIFIFLKTPQDYYVVPTLLLLGNLVSLIGVYIHMKKKLDIWFCKVTLREIKEHFQKSSTFFLSRIATTIYTSTNTVVLGLIDPAKATVGYYTSADKLVTVAKNGASPISDSIYPYMINNKDFKLIKKLLAIFMPIIALGCVIVGIFAEPLCVLFFGKEFGPVGNVLRAMLPVIFVVLPSYMLGFPTLSAVGLQKHANYAVYAGCIVDAVGILILWATHSISAVTLALMMSAAEITILVYRVIVIIRHKDLFNTPQKDD